MDRHTLTPRLALAVAVVTLCGCETADLSDRFAAEILLEGEASPSKPTRLRFFPTGDELLVTTKRGRVHHLRLGEDGFERLGSFVVPDVRPAPSDLGLTDVLFDPLFESTRRIYFCFTTGDNKTNRIVMMEWQDDYEAIPESLQVVLEVSRRKPPEAWHGIYSIEFGADRYLYAAMGDANQPEVAQDPKTLLGKLIRIEPLATGHYRIPPDNPNYGVEGVRDEMIAMGIRSPFRLVLWKDYLYFGDIGSNLYEEINLYSKENQNFGWPECEGPCDNENFRNPEIAIAKKDDAFTLEDSEPSASTQTSVVLGVVYQSSPDPYDGLLDRQLLFGDVYLGYIRAARVGFRGRLGESQHLFHLEGVTSMDIGPDGYIYGTKLFEDALFRIVPKG
jgi:glucose/arabinose dehydrogenase